MTGPAAGPMPDSPYSCIRRARCMSVPELITSILAGTAAFCSIPRKSPTTSGPKLSDKHPIVDASGGAAGQVVEFARVDFLPARLGMLRLCGSVEGTHEGRKIGFASCRCGAVRRIEREPIDTGTGRGRRAKA